MFVLPTETNAVFTLEHSIHVTLLINSNSSPSGLLLAFHHTSKSYHEIIVMKEINLNVSHILTGHLDYIHDIDWLNEKTLISVASDRTAIIWFLDEKKFEIKVMI